MSTSKHQIQVKATDQTAGAFNSIKNRAGATGAQISRMMQSAIGAAAGYLSFRAIKGGIDELGKLSDVAMKANVSVEELTKGVKAMEILGIQNASVDSLARAFTYMEKNTGRTGLRGFYQTLEELAKIPDLAKRNQEAMRIFSRDGLNFGPLINGAKEGTAALEELIAAMPGVSSAAAEAGDATADAMALISGSIKGAMLDGLGSILQVLGGQFADGTREAGALAGEKLATGFKVGILKLSRWLNEFFRGFYNDLMWTVDAVGHYLTTWDGTGSWENSMSVADDKWIERKNSLEDDVDVLNEKIAEIEAASAERIKKILNVRENMEKAAQYNKSGESESKDAAAITKAAKTISNTLYEAGTAAAVKLTMLGPKTESEQKKQTKLLEDIKKNTEKKSETEIEVFEG